MSLTPYDDINLFLQILLDNVRTVLGDYFTGMYLYGSLATGDFDVYRSDIDFLVVTSETLPKSLISDLRTMHTRVYESGLEWATKLEGTYIPIDAMRVYSSSGSACPLVNMNVLCNKNEFLVACLGFDWVINRHILYTSGVVIAGPPLQTIIDPVRPEELKKAVLMLLRDNWSPWAYNSDFFLGTGYQPFVVLTMCRALYILEHGVVASKRRSGEWAIAKSYRKWDKLINQAIKWNYGDPPGNIGQTQEFIRYTLKEAGLSVEKVS